MKTDLKEFTISQDSSILEVMACIDANAKGIALVVDEENRLVDTITDGDIRRAMLAGVRRADSIREVIDNKDKEGAGPPTTAKVDTSREELIRLARSRHIHQIPIVDDENRLIDLIILDDLLPQESLAVQAVVMAGGPGTRLRPLTRDTPKPMLPLGDRPIMEIMLQRLKKAGIHRVNVTTHYQPEKIKDHFGDGSKFGVNLRYVEEETPMGTAGALSLMDMPDEPLLVINGDILTQVDFRAMLNHHRKHKAMLTIGVRQYDMDVPFGVVESDGVYVQSVKEKPVYPFFVSAGIYLVEPTIKTFIPDGEYYDMPQLINQLLEKNETVVSFPIVEYWLDIGEHKNYEQAQEDVERGRFNL